MTCEEMFIHGKRKRKRKCMEKKSDRSDSHKGTERLTQNMIWEIAFREWKVMTDVTIVMKIVNDEKLNETLHDLN